jgi:hypothetical protein
VVLSTSGRLAVVGGETVFLADIGSHDVRRIDQVGATRFALACHGVPITRVQSLVCAVIS